LEPKVIRFQGDPTLLRLIEQHGEAQRARVAFADPAKQEVLSHSAIQNRIDQQNVPSLQIETRSERNFTPRVAAVMNIPDVLPNEMANHWAIDVADEISGKYKAAIHVHHNIESASSIGSRNVLTEHRDACRDSAGGIARSIARAHELGPSAVTDPRRILS